MLPLPARRSDLLAESMDGLQERMDRLAARIAAMEAMLKAHARAIDDLNARLHARKRGRK